MLEKIRLWWLRPGLELAAEEARRRAYVHPNAQYAGPEQNLLKLSIHLVDMASGYQDLPK
jgi:hypothetical protein